VNDTTVLTEDNELTFAIRHLGYDVLSPPGCPLETEVLTSWGDLRAQRLRWKRGALENCFEYGLTRITWRYRARQLLALTRGAGDGALPRNGCLGSRDKQPGPAHLLDRDNPHLHGRTRHHRQRPGVEIHAPDGPDGRARIRPVPAGCSHHGIRCRVFRRQCSW
jgi:hypothetical protein